MALSDDEFGEDVFEGDCDTVATVPLSRPVQFRQHPPTFESSIQVPATSPRTVSASPSRSNTPLRPTPASQMPHQVSHIARMMAPPGTIFQPPVHYSQPQSQRGRSDTTECFTQETKQAYYVSSDDEDEGEDELARGTGFKAAIFTRNGVPISRSTDRIAESPVKPSFAHFAYSGQSQPSKRSSDAMADAYGTLNRPAKVARQIGPARANPVAWLTTMTLDDIEDASIRRNVTNMQGVFTNKSVKDCMEALERKKFNYEDALDFLSAQPERPVAVDLTNSDDDMPTSSPPPAKINVKRVVAGSKTINEKWAKHKPLQYSPRPVNVQMTSSPPPAARKRKLLRGPTRPVFHPITSSPPTASSSSATKSKSKREKTPESDIDEGVIIGGSDGSDSDASVSSITDNSNVEAELVQFLNNCTVEELNEVASQPIDTVEKVIASRPFHDLDDVRAVTIETQMKGKAGKMRISKREVGTRLVDVCLEVFETYNTIDRLVAQCENLGRPIREEMRRFGFDASQKSELELTEFDHDSGIGTPSSSVDGDDGDLRRPRRLTQPRTMSSSLVMKDYQIIGLNWLALLHAKQMSGILADDMGLGKTCQVIAFLTYLVETKKATGPHLIIVPGSTLENWLREFKNFSPHLDVRPYYGTQKDRGESQYVYLDEREDINVIVTTYDMATSPADNKFLRRLEPVVCVFDEGHALKNSAAKRYQQLMRIPAQFRLLLTGTPLQNNLQELVSLLAFIMPDVFKEHHEDLALLFKHKAKTSDDSGKAALLSAERINRARSMMTPFILRRKKEQVMKHLPTKTCRVEYCSLTETQQEVYDVEAAKASTALGQKATGSLSMKQTSNVLMDLRKAAIHPLLFRRLYPNAALKKLARLYMQGDVTADVQENLVEEDFSVMTDFELNRFCNQQGRRFKPHILPTSAFSDSGKVAKLVELLKRHMSNGDRTLVFSQFTMVMDILEEVFLHEGIAFSRLDGSTKMAERQDLIDQFTDDDTIPVFMLSTKAGGAGINLACANKVIIFDSSFNPQDDIQAENRAHRVGQKREVEVIRLVSRDTIEVQIMALGQTKLALDNRVAGEADSGKDDAATAEGMRLVERMLNGEAAPDLEDGVKMEELEDQGRPPRPKTDLKDDFLAGLKGAGLKVAG